MEETRCLVCGRKVTDPDSVARKIGTTCWSRLVSLRSTQNKRRRKARAKKRKAGAWEQPGLFEEDKADGTGSGGKLHDTVKAGYSSPCNPSVDQPG